MTDAVAINAAILFFVTRYGKQDELSEDTLQPSNRMSSNGASGRRGEAGRKSCDREGPSRRVSWALSQQALETGTTHTIAFEGILIDRIEESTVDVEKTSSQEKDDSDSEGPTTPALPTHVSRSFGSITSAERQAIAPFADSLSTRPPPSNSETSATSSSYLSSRRGSSFEP